jgi:signal transduction histidine kinase
MLEDLERLDRLINQMLDAGRLDVERSDDSIEEIELEPLVRFCVEDVCAIYRLPKESI